MLDVSLLWYIVLQQGTTGSGRNLSTPSLSRSLYCT